MDHFEEINNKSISGNVYVEDENQTSRADRITKIERPSCHINLLRIEKKNNEHYVLIKDFSRLAGRQTNKTTNKMCCSFCQHGFKSEKLLNSHLIKRLYGK